MKARNLLQETNCILDRAVYALNEAHRLNVHTTDLLNATERIDPRFTPKTESKPFEPETEPRLWNLLEKLLGSWNKS